MILATHAIVGVALTRPFTSYAAAAAMGFVSHYVFDAIPHWHYYVPRIKRVVTATNYKPVSFLKPEFIPELLLIISDLMGGFFVAGLFFRSSNITHILVAAFFAILPDLLVGLCRSMPHPVLIAHDKFHRFMHARHLLDDYPILGIGSQVLIVVGILFLFR